MVKVSVGLGCVLAYSQNLIDRIESTVAPSAILSNKTLTNLIDRIERRDPPVQYDLRSPDPHESNR